MARICVRRETKNLWERRAPLSPTAVADLRHKGLEIDVETSPIRVYSDKDYSQCGAEIVERSDGYDVVVGIKEPPLDTVGQGQVQVVFSHTIKGQAQNMPLLRRFLDRQATLIDYERITNDEGKRVIAFGRFAGIAGAADSLWITGQKLRLMEKPTPLSQLKQCVEYGSMAKLREAISQLEPLTGYPLRVLIVGGGNSGRGAAEVMRWLGLRQITASAVTEPPPGSWYAMMRTRDVMESIDGGPFDMGEYKRYGGKRYRSCFDRYLGHFNLLIQTAYWDKSVPKHLDVSRLADTAEQLPIVIGDVSCDIMGSLECTQRITTIDEPTMTYDPKTNHIEPGIHLSGPTVMAVDNLPCELPLDASDHFSQKLEPLMPEIARAANVINVNDLQPAIARAVIVFRGELTHPYRYLERYL